MLIYTKSCDFHFVCTITVFVSLNKCLDITALRFIFYTERAHTYYRTNDTNTNTVVLAGNETTYYMTRVDSFFAQGSGPSDASACGGGASPPICFLVPDTMSSILNNNIAV